VRKMMIALALGLSLFGSGSAWAQPALDFTIPSSPGGSISYAGGPTSLSGTGIGISEVQGESTDLNNLVELAVSNGSMSFTTGALVSSSGGTWTFGAGGAGSFTLTGGIASLGLGSSTVLLSGEITSVTATNIGGPMYLTWGGYFNSVNTALAGYYGVSSNIPWTGTFYMGFTASVNPTTGAFSNVTVESGDVITVTPEPSSLAIASISGLGLIGYGFRRRKALGA